MVTMTYKYIKQLLMLMFWLVCSQTASAKVVAHLDQSSVDEGDIITLTVETEKADAEMPDVSALSLYFDILNTTTNSQVSIINGQVSKQKIWQFNLQPKITGDIVIPSMTVAAEYTQPLKLTVKSLPVEEKSEVKAEAKQHIFIEASIGELQQDIYVQQQIPYTIKLYYDDSMLAGNMSELQVENAIATQLGKEKRYRATRAGQQYIVLEKNFVISPEKSGTLHIPPITISGQLAIGDAPKQIGQRRFIDDFFNDQFNRSRMPRKPFSMDSEAIDINVLPIPKAFTGATWLPATSFVIQDSWQKHLPEFRVGEPVKRTLTLQAKGLTGSQIPTLDIPRPNGMKVYIDPIETDTTTDGKAVYGNQRVTITYIPNRAGKITVPKIQVDFWDVVHKQQESVILPAITLTIAAGAGNVGSSELAPDIEAKPVVRSEAPETDNKETLVSAKDEKPQSAILNKLVAAGLFLLVGLGIALGWRRYKKPESSEHVDLAALKQSLIQACEQNNNQLAALSLLAFVRAQWQDDSIHNLTTLASRLETGGEIIHILADSLYAPDASHWEGKALKQLVQQRLQAQHSKLVATQDGLQPLYPNI